MRDKLLHPATVIAVIALFVALGGTSYAVSQLPKNSVGNKQLKKNAVTSKKVKDGSLLAKDFKTGQLPQGQQGERGPQGEQGPQGAAGVNGATGSALLTGAITDSLPQPNAGVTYFRRAAVNYVGTDASGISSTEAQSLTPNRSLRISNLAVRTNNDLPSGGSVLVTAIATSPGGNNSTLECQVVGGAGASDQTCTSSGSATIEPGSLIYMTFAVGRSAGGLSAVNPDGIRWGLSIEPTS